MKEECKCIAEILGDKSRRANDQLEQRVAKDAKRNKKGVCKCFNSMLQGKWRLIGGWENGLVMDGYGKG